MRSKDAQKQLARTSLFKEARKGFLVDVVFAKR